MSRILVYTGHGKGKTTAALGLVLRAVGHGFPVALVQFLKSRQSVGELQGLACLPGVRFYVGGAGFVPSPEHQAYARHVRAAQKAMRWARAALNSEHYPVVVLDEICGALHKGLVDLETFLTLLQGLPDHKIVVCTGRNGPQGLIEIADTVTEMRLCKHALESGVRAEQGVEF